MSDSGSRTNSVIEQCSTVHMNTLESKKDRQPPAPSSPANIGSLIVMRGGEDDKPIVGQSYIDKVGTKEGEADEKLFNTLDTTIDHVTQLPKSIDAQTFKGEVMSDGSIVSPSEIAENAAKQTKVMTNVDSIEATNLWFAMNGLRNSTELVDKLFLGFIFEALKNDSPQAAKDIENGKIHVPTFIMPDDKYEYANTLHVAIEKDKQRMKDEEIANRKQQRGSASAASSSTASIAADSMNDDSPPPLGPVDDQLEKRVKDNMVKLTQIGAAKMLKNVKNSIERTLGDESQMSVENIGFLLKRRDVWPMRQFKAFFNNPKNIEIYKFKPPVLGMFQSMETMINCRQTVSASILLPYISTYTRIMQSINDTYISKLNEIEQELQHNQALVDEAQKKHDEIRRQEDEEARLRGEYPPETGPKYVLKVDGLDDLIIDNTDEDDEQRQRKLDLEYISMLEAGKEAEPPELIAEMEKDDEKEEDDDDEYKADINLEIGSSKPSQKDENNIESIVPEAGEQKRDTKNLPAETINSLRSLFNQGNKYDMVARNLGVVLNRSFAEIEVHKNTLEKRKEHRLGVLTSMITEKIESMRIEAMNGQFETGHVSLVDEEEIFMRKCKEQDERDRLICTLSTPLQEAIAALEENDKDILITPYSDKIKEFHGRPRMDYTALMTYLTDAKQVDSIVSPPINILANISSIYLSVYIELNKQYRLSIEASSKIDPLTGKKLLGAKHYFSPIETHKILETLTSLKKMMGLIHYVLVPASLTRLNRITKACDQVSKDVESIEQQKQIYEAKFLELSNPIIAVEQIDRFISCGQIRQLEDKSITFSVYYIMIMNRLCGWLGYWREWINIMSANHMHEKEQRFLALMTLLIRDDEADIYYVTTIKPYLDRQKEIHQKAQAEQKAKADERANKAEAAKAARASSNPV